MALLGILRKFNAKHGSKNVRQDEFSIEFTVQGALANGFVGDIDATKISADLETVIGGLKDAYLDDVIGRATSENIAAYIAYQMRNWPVHSVKVHEGNAHYGEVFKSDIDFSNYEALQAYNLARSFLFRQKTQKAIESATLAIQLLPDFAEAYNLLGRCFRTLGDWKNALPNFEKAAQLKPDYGEAYRNLGNAYCYLGKTDEMIPMFTRAVQLMPQVALAWNNRGYAYQRLGLPEQAINDHRKAIELDPNYAEAHSDLATALKATGDFVGAETESATAKLLAEKGVDTYAPGKLQMY